MTIEAETIEECYQMACSIVRVTQSKGASFRHDVASCACSVCLAYRKACDVRLLLDRARREEG